MALHSQKQRPLLLCLFLSACFFERSLDRSSFVSISMDRCSEDPDAMNNFLSNDLASLVLFCKVSVDRFKIYFFTP